MIVTGSWDGKIVVSEAGSLKRLQSLNAQELGVNGVTFSLDSKQLAAVGWKSSSVIVWDTAEWKARTFTPDGNWGTNGVAFSPDGKLLVTACSDMKVRVYNAASGEVRYTLAGHSHFVNSVAFAPTKRVGEDGKLEARPTLLASASNDNTVRLWSGFEDGEPKELDSRKFDSFVRVARFSSDGQWLYAGDLDGKLQRWHMKVRGDKYEAFDLGQGIRDLAVNPIGDFVLVAPEGVTGQASVFYRPHHQLRARWDAHNEDVTATAWSPDGKTIVTGSTNGVLRLWSAEAVLEFGIAKPKDKLSWLIERLLAGDRTSWDAADDGLREMRHLAWPVADELLSIVENHPDDETAWMAGWALLEIDYSTFSRAIPALERRDFYEGIRRRVAGTMRAKLATDAEELWPLLQHESIYVRSLAGTRLIQLKPSAEAVVPKLTALLAGETERERRLLLINLLAGGFGSEAAPAADEIVSVLVDSIGDRHAIVFYSGRTLSDFASDALGEIGPAAVPPLVDQLHEHVTTGDAVEEEFAKSYSQRNKICRQLITALTSVLDGAELDAATEEKLVVALSKPEYFYTSTGDAVSILHYCSQGREDAFRDTIFRLLDHESDNAYRPAIRHLPDVLSKDEAREMLLSIIADHPDNGFRLGSAIETLARVMSTDEYLRLAEQWEANYDDVDSAISAGLAKLEKPTEEVYWRLGRQLSERRTTSAAYALQRLARRQNFQALNDWGVASKRPYYTAIHLLELVLPGGPRKQQMFRDILTRKESSQYVVLRSESRRMVFRHDAASHTIDELLDIATSADSNHSEHNEALLMLADRRDEWRDERGEKIARRLLPLLEENSSSAVVRVVFEQLGPELLPVLLPPFETAVKANKEVDCFRSSVTRIMESYDGLPAQVGPLLLTLLQQNNSRGNVIRLLPKVAWQDTAAVEAALEEIIRRDTRLDNRTDAKQALAAIRNDVADPTGNATIDD